LCRVVVICCPLCPVKSTVCLSLAVTFRLRRGEMRWFALMGCHVYPEEQVVAFNWCARFPRCPHHVPWKCFILLCAWRPLAMRSVLFCVQCSFVHPWLVHIQ